MNQTTRCVLLVLAMAGSSALGAAAAGGDRLARLGWLAGCWVEESATGRREELWMAPLGKTMLGVSRTVVAGETVEYEYLRIEDQDGVLVYIAAPSGQAITSFRQIELTDSTVVFADPTHDFPERIRYRRVHGDSLLAQIEGQRKGETRVIDFPLRRRPCD
jgi:hypothetical protein